METRAGLADYLGALLADLGTAAARAEKDKSLFSLDNIALEVDICYTLVPSADAPAAARPVFWVRGAGEEGTDTGIAASGDQALQRLSMRLYLRPETVAPDASQGAGAPVVLPLSHTIDR